MSKKRKRIHSGLPRRFGACALAAAMVASELYAGPVTALAASTSNSWKTDLETALQDLQKAEGAADDYSAAQEALKNAYDSLEGSQTVEGLVVTGVGTDYINLMWNKFEADGLLGYNVYWADSNTDTTKFQLLDADSNNVYDETVPTISVDKADVSGDSISFTVKMSTFKNLWFKVAPVTAVGAGSKTEAVMSPTAVAYKVQLENIGRGMTATAVSGGVFLNWRLLCDEVDGYSDTGLTGYDFNVYRGGEKIATVTDSTNYLDKGNTTLGYDTYKIVPVKDGEEIADKAVTDYVIFTADADNKDTAYFDIPLQKPADTTFRETYGIDTMALGGYTWTDSGYGAVDDTITYSANDMSVADVDGDGEYEYLVKWDPSYSKDVSQQGYTGKAYIDCYELDGTIRWRLDLGVNIRAGAHYTEFGAYDYDGDGKAEMMIKTAPGSKMTSYELGEDGKNTKNADGTPKVASEKYVTIVDEKDENGNTVTNDSNYVFSAADYREYLIDVFQDWGVWSRYSEETVKNAIEGHWSNNLVTMFTTSAEWSDKTFYTGEVASAANVTKNMGSMTTEDIQQYIPEYKEGDVLVNVAIYGEDGKVEYPSSSTGTLARLKTVRLQDVKKYYGGFDLESVNHDGGYTEKEATLLADYFLKHYQYRMKKHNLNVYEGYIITGPEYISLFDCETGAELDTQNWYYGREDDGMLWGDYAMNYIEPGNRCDRFNVLVAYLDGETPSCVMGRGYYTRTTMAAYNVVDKKLQLAGAIDSGWTVMNNPFNDGPHGYNGCDPVNGELSGQGDHYIAVADIDLDGRQDIINGGAIVSYDMGKKDLYLYSSGRALNTNDPSKGLLKYGHGDAIHITDIDPDRPGLEIVSCFEGGSWAPYNWALRDARSNVAIFGVPGSTDFGRITIGDVLKDVKGLEIDTGFDCAGNAVTLAGTSNNMNIKWSADMSTQFVSGTTNVSIIGNADGKAKTFVSCTGYATNNSTKGNPCLVADLFGDYREEMILRKADSTSIRIYMNTEVSTHKNYTLMQNAQYRVGIASQNSAYNQPAYTDYYYASDADWSRVTVPNAAADQAPGNVVVQPTGVSIDKTSVTVYTGNTCELTAIVSPAIAEQQVTWSVDDESIATISADGIVTAVAAGTAIVTATTSNGKTATAKIIVKTTYVDADTDKFAIGESKTYTFGTSGTVKADTVYSKENGYGWQEHSDKITLTDGADYVAGTNHLETANNITTWEYPTFVVDVPAGIYDVKIVQGTNGKDKAVNGAYVEGNMYSVRWSTETFTTSYTMPSEKSWIYTNAGETKETTVETAVADGQLTINLATSLTDADVSGTTYIKEIVVTRKKQNTSLSAKPTLRFIGDSTLAKYPPEDGQTWTPIPERTGWGEDFSMGKFVDEDVVLVNKAVAGSSLKSYIYDGYYNDFFLNSRPGDTVIIESGINDSAAGRRYSNAAEFEAGLRYLIKSCQAFGLDVIISSGTSSDTDYTAKMSALAEEFGIPYVDLLGQWGTYLGKVGSPNLTVDGTHLKRVGGIVAAQIVASSIKDLEGYSISGHVLDVPLNYEKPTVKVTGLSVKAQTEDSVTLAWNISEDEMYEQDQLITDFVVYGKKKGSSDEAKAVVTQTAYVSAGMEGPQLYVTFPAPADTYTYYVTAKGVTGEGSASRSIDVAKFVPTDAYTLQSLIEQYNMQLYDASVYTTESYAALKVELANADALLAKADVTDEEITAELAKVKAAVEGLKKNTTTLVETTFSDEALKTAPWGVTGSHSSLMSAIMDTDGNKLLKLYVEAAGERKVNKVFDGAADVDAATEMIEFAWYPGKPDNRNCTEVEFWSDDSTRVLSLKSAKVSDNEGHIGYVVGNYPDNTSYLTGSGFHAYEGSTAVDLGLDSEAWYNVKIVFNFADGTADLYIVPMDGSSQEGKTVKGIKINTAKKTITKMNFLLMRGKQDNGTSNDLSILWDSRFDDYGVYYTDKKNTVDKAAYEAAEKNYLAKIAGLNDAALSDEKFALADAVIDIMAQDVGFNTADDYAYAVSVLNAAAEAAPAQKDTESVKVTADQATVVAGLTAEVKAELSAGANEDIVWSTSDQNVATVEGYGLDAVVTARKAGTVQITATGVNSKKAGSVTLTVTGTGYFFGADTAEAYDAETGYGFMDYTYPNEAKGWIKEKDAYTDSDKDVFSARELVASPGMAYVDLSASTDEYLAINSQVWTELHEGGREEDTITYENTNAFAADLENGNYRVVVTFANPGKLGTNVMVKAEDIRRYDFGDHATRQIAQTTVKAGQTATAGFDVALTDGQLTLRFEQDVADSTYEAAATRTAYVKSVSVEKIDSLSSDAKKTTIYTVGDSTVQTYIKANYRNGWAQMLYTLFGTEEKKEETDTGYAYYETEDTIIKNYARDGRSAKSFLEEGRLNEVLLNVNAGDYVFLQFAHNDDNTGRPNRYLNIDSYKAYLSAYNKALAERGATLVLVTPIVLNVWEEDGSLDHRFDDYRLAMMQLAAKEDIPVLDLMGATLELVSAMGSANVNALNMYMSDTVHTQPAGAEMFKNLLGNLLSASTDAKLANVQKLMDVKTDKKIEVGCADLLKVGETSDITVTGAAIADVKLYNSDESVVKIQDGKLVAVGEGSAIITAGYVTGDTATTDCTAYTGYAVVTVSNDEPGEKPDEPGQKPDEPGQKPDDPSDKPSDTPSDNTGGTTGGSTTQPTTKPEEKPGDTTEAPEKGEAVTSGDNEYTVSTEGKEVTFTASADKKATSVTIPSTIKVDGVTYKVTAIEDGAFEKSTSLKKVTIGKNVTEIGENAFAGCTNVTTLKFASGSQCKVIGDNAFKNNKKLTSATLPDSVKTVGNNAFAGCTSMKKVAIGKNVTEIGENAFAGCTSITTLKFASDSKCKVIGDNAFKNNKKLTSATLPNTVQTVGTNAFAGCTSMKKVTIGSKVKTIGEKAFYGNKKLSTITITSTKLTKVSKNALKGTKKNLVIKVPKSKVEAYKKLFTGKGQSNFKVEAITEKRSLFSGLAMKLAGVDRSEVAVVETEAAEAVAAVTEAAVVEADAVVLGAEEQTTTSNVTVYTDAAVDGKMASPLADYQFDFGYKNGNAPAPFKSIVADKYAEEKGYGFISDPSGFSGSHVANHRDDNVVANGDSEYDMALYAAVKDGARQPEWEFAIDLPAGEYMVNVYVGSGKNTVFAGASYYINDVQICDSWTLKGDSYSVDDCGMSARVVLAEDGQVVVKGEKAKSLALISAITVSEYVDRIDAYDADAWAAADAEVASLLVKTGMFGVDSTPFDYDAVLVNKMLSTKKALEGVKYHMPLADTTDGDAVYVLAEEAVENSTLYTEASMAVLQAAMADYETAKSALDISDAVKDAYDVIEFWLQGVDTENLADAYAGYFDFNTTQTGGSSYSGALAEEPGWIPVGGVADHPYFTAYSQETGYGLAGTTNYAGRIRSTDDLMLADFLMDPVFQVDLPAGEFNVVAYTGDINAGCKGVAQYDFYVDYVDADNKGTLIHHIDEVTSPTAEYVTATGNFKLESAATVTMVASRTNGKSAYSNGVIFEQVLPVTVEKYNVTELATVVNKIAAENLNETDYTISSWAAFKAAYDEAKAAVEKGASYVQQVATVQTNLEEAYAGLTKRVAAKEIVLDFGPAFETDGTPGRVHGSTLIGGFLPEGVTLSHATPDLGLGTMLYDTNMDDNGIHYGFTSEVASGHTATGGNYFRDWVYGAGGSAYTFKADVPAGKYKVYVYTGCKEAANTTKFYFGNGEAALETENAANAAVDAEGRTVYTQTSNAGGQFVAPGCIYTVNVAPSETVLSTVSGTTFGTFSLTCFNDDANLAADEITARLNGIELVYIGESGENLSETLVEAGEDPENLVETLENPVDTTENPGEILENPVETTEAPSDKPSDTPSDNTGDTTEGSTDQPTTELEEKPEATI